jgi:hypothetical protein
VAKFVLFRLSGEEKQRMHHSLVECVAIENVGEIHQTAAGFDHRDPAEHADRGIKYTRTKCCSASCYTPKGTEKRHDERLVSHFSEMLNNVFRIGVGSSFRQCH